MSIARYFHTVRHLRPAQIFGRVTFRLFPPRPDLSSAPPLRLRTGAWTVCCERPSSMSGPEHFVFLNVEHVIDSLQFWNELSWGKLWLYNLHYFDDLNAGGGRDRIDWHQRLLHRWVAENPPGRGVGWEPYPTSLRIVNWVKWSLAGNVLPGPAVQSLAVQARFLIRRLETHLLGNHLFANAKALVFAGLFFDGPEADSWLDRGMELLNAEIAEQILLDGGHFERSPMYHAIVLEDLLDLVNVLQAYGYEIPVQWVGRISLMRRWLKALVHPDGEIAFFNDSALGIACREDALDAYAIRLGLAAVPPLISHVIHLAESGYIRIEQGDAVVLVDAGSVGPDYLPAHAHAETLSFELSHRGERVLVNSGTSVYEPGPERDRQRGTAAHNAVVVDGQNSSEVWAAFRVARRARIRDVVVEGKEIFVVRATHDGYRRLPGRPTHGREWRVEGRALHIIDRLDGAEQHCVEIIYHLHPGVSVSTAGRCAWRLHHGSAGDAISLTIEGAQECSDQADSYHPEFGVSRENRRLYARYRGSFPAEIRTTLRW